MRGRFPVMAAVVISFGFSAAWAACQVQPDKENVVGSRLVGRWQPHAALTARLTGRPTPQGGESPSGPIAFESEPSVAQKIPAKYDKFLGTKRVYMAGLMRMRGKDYPFLLIEHCGNPHVVYFRERDGDPLGDAESFNVMLAVAKDAASDLLFVGGDFNNQPFDAYERGPQPSEK